MRIAVAVVVAWAASSSAVSAADAGNELFNANCSLCHQQAGQGLPGQFPRLAGRVNDMARTDDGRTYLAGIVLFGMNGTVEVDGELIVGVMPACANLSDAELADILNHTLRLKKAKKIKPFKADEVVAVRKAGFIPSSALHEMRNKLDATKAPS